MEEAPEVALWYCDSHIGRTYRLQIGDEYFPLENGSLVGSAKDEAGAKASAVDLLARFKIECDLTRVRFRKYEDTP